MCSSAKGKLRLWMEVSLCATHTATAQAQMGAGCCLGSGLEEGAHTSAYMFLSSRVASLLATASQKILHVPLHVNAEGGEDHTSLPASPATTSHHEHRLVTKCQVARQLCDHARLSLDAPNPSFATHASKSRPRP